MNSPITLKKSTKYNEIQIVIKDVKTDEEISLFQGICQSQQGKNEIISHWKSSYERFLQHWTGLKLKNAATQSPFCLRPIENSNLYSVDWLKIGKEDHIPCGIPFDMSDKNGKWASELIDQLTACLNHWYFFVKTQGIDSSL